MARRNDGHIIYKSHSVLILWYVLLQWMERCLWMKSVQGLCMSPTYYFRKCNGYLWPISVVLHTEAQTQTPPRGLLWRVSQQKAGTTTNCQETEWQKKKYILKEKGHEGVTFGGQRIALYFLFSHGPTNHFIIPTSSSPHDPYMRALLIMTCSSLVFFIYSPYLSPSKGNINLVWGWCPPASTWQRRKTLVTDHKMLACDSDQTPRESDSL